MVISDKSVLIFGCGNILWGDDGFAQAVIQHLKGNYPLPDEVLALDVGTSIRDILFDLILIEKKPERLIIVDAVDYPQRRPGEVFEIPVAGIPKQKVSDFCLHQFPTVNLLQELQEQSRYPGKDHRGADRNHPPGGGARGPVSDHPGGSGDRLRKDYRSHFQGRRHLISGRSATPDFWVIGNFWLFLVVSGNKIA